MANKLFLLDAYALIYRGYWALSKNPRINSKGIDTTAILGFVNTLEEVLREEKPEYIAVAFDPKGGTFRHEVYPKYKAQREKTPEGIEVGLPYIKKILQAYNIPIFEIPGFEADDVIGTLAEQASKTDVVTYMMTPDKDYGQLVKDNVLMYSPNHIGHGFTIKGPKAVMEKYGLSHPTQVIDLLGLMGDSSDNIPGCPGVGEVTAVKLIGEFGSVENLLEHTDQLKGALKAKIEGNAELIKFSKFLATIKTDVPITLNLDELRKKEINKDEVRRLFEELEFRSLLKRVLGNLQPQPRQLDLFSGDLFSNIPDKGTESPEKTQFQELKNLNHNYKLVEKEEEICQLVQKFLISDFICLDTETTSLNTIDAELVGLSFSVKENEAFYVPIPRDFNAAKKIVEKFREIYENEKILKIGQNLKYDMEVLLNYGIELRGQMFDTMLAHYLLFPEMKHNMDEMARNYLGYDPIPIERLIGSGKQQKNMRDLMPTEVYEYAAEDADVTLKLKHVFEKMLREEGLMNLFETIEMPLLPVLVRMERNGVRIDENSLRETSADFNQRMQEIEGEVYELAGKKFNVSSP
ncbi:MAG: DNA polymerase I, partial [Bacteroidales bacterium]|nr:DNA polymerase I [Bacteroidales bacterium]